MGMLRWAVLMIGCGSCLAEGAGRPWPESWLQHFRVSGRLAFDEQKPLFVNWSYPQPEDGTKAGRPGRTVKLGFFFKRDRPDSLLDAPYAANRKNSDLEKVLRLTCVDSTGKDMGPILDARLDDRVRRKSFCGALTYGGEPSVHAEWLHLTGKMRVRYYDKRTAPQFVRVEIRDGAEFDVGDIHVKVAYKKPNWDDGDFNHEIFFSYDSRKEYEGVVMKFQDEGRKALTPENPDDWQAMLSAAESNELKNKAGEDRKADYREGPRKFKLSSRDGNTTVATENGRCFVFRKKPDVLHVAFVYWEKVSYRWIPIDLRFDLGVKKAQKPQAAEGGESR